MTTSPGTVLIRPARLADLPSCARIINDYIDASDWLPRHRSHQQIAEMFNDGLLKSRIVLVADAAHEIVGYASFDPGSSFLASMYLAEAARGRGTGRALLADVKRHAPGGFSLTCWQQNPAARRFYEREGLAYSRDGVDDDGLAVWHLTWSGVHRPVARS